MGYATNVPLFDHHCHGLIQEQLSLPAFAELATEGDWLPEDIPQVFDSPFGIAMRRICAPILGLKDNCSTTEYLEARGSRSFIDVATPLLHASGTSEFGIETGFPKASIASAADMQQLSGQTAHTIVRLEAIAEAIAPSTSAATFYDEFCAKLDADLAAGAIGVKTIAAYRFGLDLPEHPPIPSEREAAVDTWLQSAQQHGNYRVSDRTIIGALVWAAIERAQPIQLHVGFGDTDVQLNTADPSLLTPLLRSTEKTGARFALLHCYPFIREAAVLSHIFPHVYFDTSCVSHYAGPSATKLVAEAFEVAPFSRILYASDAYGIPEHYAVSAAIWRTAIDRVFSAWVADGFVSEADAERIVRAVAHGNAHTLYQL